jgi:hypothetical protein
MLRVLRVRQLRRRNRKKLMSEIELLLSLENKRRRSLHDFSKKQKRLEEM